MYFLRPLANIGELKISVTVRKGSSKDGVIGRARSGCLSGKWEWLQEKKVIGFDRDL